MIFYTALSEGCVGTTERNEMKGFSGHTSYYVNVGQTIGIIGGLVLGFKALRVEEAKAGIQRRPLKDVVVDDIRRVKTWYSDNFGATKMYTHH